MLRQLMKGSAEGTGVQFFRYVFVGGGAFILDFLTLYILTNFLHVYYLISAGIAFIAGTLFNYIFSTLWVFNKRSIDARWLELTAFAAIGGIGLGMNELLMFVFTDWLRVFYLLSKIIAAASVFFWNFFARKYLLFNENG